MQKQLSPSLSSFPSRCLTGVCAVILAALFVVASADAAVPNFKGSSADGTIVFFETEEQLVPGDTDTKRDVYGRSFDAGVGTYVTRQVSLGPAGGNDAYVAQFEGANQEGDLVFFSTEERLVTDDLDRSVDVYMRDLEDGTTTQVTVGDGAFAATFADTTASGDRVFFETKEPLAGGDADTSTDLYLRDLGAGETHLVSAAAAGCTPGCGNGAFEVSRRGISADGSYAYFTTAEPLAGGDTDGAFDVYARDLGTETTSLVSIGGCAGCGNSGAVPIFNGASGDGDRVFFSSEEKLVAADDDEATDVYARDLPAGPTILVSGGTADVTASFAAASTDGLHVFFTSAEGLVAADDDTANDVYEWTAGVLDLITPASCSSFCGANFDAVSADSTQVLFTTAQPLAPEDEDAHDDIYRQAVSGGAPVLVSRGEGSCPSCWNGAFHARFNEASADLSRVAFTTAEGVLGEDEDGEDDIYLRDVDGGTSSLITIAPSYCPLKKGNCGATFVGSSEDGLHVFFRTVERFTLEDGDNEADVYERFLGGEEVTRLVSTGNDPNLELGPEPPTLTGTNPGSPGSTLTPRVLGETMAGATVKIYASEDCAGEPVATGTGAGLLNPGLPVTVLADSLTTFRATAEAEGFVSDCSEPVAYQHLAEEGGPGENEGEPEVLPESVFVVPGADRPAPLPEPTYLIPLTRITFAPASKTRSRNPVFRFTDATGQPGTTFQCKVDRKPWRGCASPLRLKRLSRGRHTLAIKGVNAAGTPEPKPAKRTFRVVAR